VGLVKASHGVRSGAVGKREKMILLSRFEVDVEELGKIVAAAVVLASVM
jgi:hypothetical protein